MSFVVTRDELLDIGAQVQEMTLPSLGTLYGVHRDGSRQAEFLGTCTYFSDGDETFALTAHHVVAAAARYAYVFHDRGGDGETMFPLRGGWIAHSNPNTDLAVWRCFAEGLHETSVRPLRVDEFQSSNLAADAGFYCHGFPGELHVSIPAVREYRSRLQGILARAANPRAPIDPQMHFGIEYHSNIDPRGMSGSPVWNLNLHRVNRLEDWAISMISFAGVCQRWHPDSTDPCLIATRVEVIREFLPHAMHYLRSQ